MGPDAGPVGPDAGPDAGTLEPDAGTTTPPGDDGCGCTVGHKPERGNSPILFIFLAMLATLCLRRDRLFKSMS